MADLNAGGEGAPYMDVEYIDDPMEDPQEDVEMVPVAGPSDEGAGPSREATSSVDTGEGTEESPIVLDDDEDEEVNEEEDEDTSSNQNIEDLNDIGNPSSEPEATSNSAAECAPSTSTANQPIILEGGAILDTTPAELTTCPKCEKAGEPIFVPYKRVNPRTGRQLSVWRYRCPFKKDCGVFYGDMYTFSKETNSFERMDDEDFSSLSITRAPINDPEGILTPPSTSQEALSSHDSVGQEEAESFHDSVGQEEAESFHDSVGQEEAESFHDSVGQEEAESFHDSVGQEEAEPSHYNVGQEEASSSNGVKEEIEEDDRAQDDVRRSEMDPPPEEEEVTVRQLRVRKSAAEIKKQPESKAAKRTSGSRRSKTPSKKSVEPESSPSVDGQDEPMDTSTSTSEPSDEVASTSVEPQEQAGADGDERPPLPTLVIKRPKNFKCGRGPDGRWLPLDKKKKKSASSGSSIARSAPSSSTGESGVIRKPLSRKAAQALKKSREQEARRRKNERRREQRAAAKRARLEAANSESSPEKPSTSSATVAVAKIVKPLVVKRPTFRSPPAPTAAKAPVAVVIPKVECIDGGTQTGDDEHITSTLMEKMIDEQADSIGGATVPKNIARKLLMSQMLMKAQHEQMEKLKEQNSQLKTAVTSVTKLFETFKESTVKNFMSIRQDSDSLKTEVQFYHDELITDAKQSIQDLIAEKKVVRQKYEDLERKKTKAEVDLEYALADLKVTNDLSFVLHRRVALYEKKMNQANTERDDAESKLSDRLFMANNAKCFHCNVTDKMKKRLTEEVTQITLDRDKWKKASTEAQNAAHEERQKTAQIASECENLRRMRQQLEFEKRTYQAQLTNAQQEINKLKAQKDSGGHRDGYIREDEYRSSPAQSGRERLTPHDGQKTPRMGSQTPKQGGHTPNINSSNPPTNGLLLTPADSVIDSTERSEAAASSPPEEGEVRTPKSTDDVEKLAKLPPPPQPPLPFSNWIPKVKKPMPAASTKVPDPEVKFFQPVASTSQTNENEVRFFQQVPMSQRGTTKLSSSKNRREEQPKKPVWTPSDSAPQHQHPQRNMSPDSERKARMEIRRQADEMKAKAEAAVNAEKKKQHLAKIIAKNPIPSKPAAVNNSKERIISKPTPSSSPLSKTRPILRPEGGFNGLTKPNVASKPGVSTEKQVEEKPPSMFSLAKSARIPKKGAIKGIPGVNDPSHPVANASSTPSKQNVETSDGKPETKKVAPPKPTPSPGATNTNVPPSSVRKIAAPSSIPPLMSSKVDSLDRRNPMSNGLEEWRDEMARYKAKMRNQQMPPFNGPGPSSRPPRVDSPDSEFRYERVGIGGKLVDRPSSYAPSPHVFNGPAAMPFNGPASMTNHNPRPMWDREDRLRPYDYGDDWDRRRSPIPPPLRDSSFGGAGSLPWHRDGEIRGPDNIWRSRDEHWALLQRNNTSWTNGDSWSSGGGGDPPWHQQQRGGQPNGPSSSRRSFWD